MNRLVKVLILLMPGLLFVQCRKQPSSSAGRFKDSRITMEKGACYGTCPVYSITISGTGKAEYEGRQFVDRVGTYEKQLNPREISQLFNAFECANFFDFQSEYTADISDLPTTWVTFEHRGFKRKVKDYYQAPEELKKLEKMIEDIAMSSEGWSKTK